MAEDNVVLEVLSSLSGHTEVFLKDNPEDRQQLAAHVDNLLSQGHAVFLMEGDNAARRIKGYDKDKNEWLLAAGRKKQLVRVSAKGTRATGVPKVAGG